MIAFQIGWVHIQKGRLSMHRGKIAVGATIVVVALVGAVAAMKWLWPSVADRKPNLAEVRPLAPITRSSRIVLPAAIELTAIREAMERSQRDFSGKLDIPSPPGSNAEITWSGERGAFAVEGRAEGLTLSTTWSGTLRATGQFGPPGFPGGPPGGGLFGGPPGGFFGPPPGGAFPGPLGGLFGGSQSQPQSQDQADRTSEQRADVNGNIVLTVRPSLLPGWRVEPNIVSQVTIADASAMVMGRKLSLSSELKPLLERKINDLVSVLQARVGNDPAIEQAARKQWAEMCRSIPLGAAAPGTPNLWLELRPTRALAAQPRIDQSAVTLTFGVEAETRIVSVETKPDCSFPAQLDLVPQMEQGRINLDVPVDIPFTEISRLLEAQLKGKTFPEDKSGSFVATIQAVNLAASGDRLLISLRVKANETKSWFGFGAEAMVHVWGRPALDRGRRMLRIDNISVDVESAAAFGLLGAAAKAAVPYLERTLADNARVDLAPLTVNARKGIADALADFQRMTKGVRVDAEVDDVRLAAVEFDAKTLRVIAEADGTLRVAVSALPAQ
jgi:Domain of unknown function (DUF4403)